MNANSGFPENSGQVENPTIAPSGRTPSMLPGEPATLEGRPSAESKVALPALAGYEMVQEIGRGGMGVVYKARQKGLKRLVALKMILAGSYAGADHISRFRAEAEAVARLEHPNIVQIHEIGEAEGLPFLSLELVEGGSLADKLQGTPQPPPLAAQLLQILASAVHYAHQHGIIHRDLKPANVLLKRESPDSSQVLSTVSQAASTGLFSTLATVRTSQRHWQEVITRFGTPKITDFGLAKPVQGESGLTQSGAILGTPSYMAPEQAEAKSVGPLADVYALGAILYEMLTGRPPFRAGTPLDTILQLLADDPVPPGRIQPKLPGDLETICLKCLEKDPDKRYSSALALAEDLGRFLTDEPIRAKRTGPVRRVVKWARRRPALAALLAVVVIAGLVLMGVIAASNIRLKEERDFAQEQKKLADIQRDAATQAREEAEAQRLRAEASFERARQAVEQMLTRVGDEKLKNVPLLEQLQRDLLEDALEFNKRFLEDRGSDPTVRRETGRAYFRAGAIRGMLGQHDQAITAYRQAIHLQQQLVEEVPATSAYQREMGQSFEGLGRELALLNQYSEAEQAYDHARCTLKTLADRLPEEPAYRKDLALVYARLAGIYSSTTRWQEVEKPFRQALTFQGDLVKEFPKVADYKRDRAMTQDSFGIFLATNRRPKEAEHMFLQAMADHEALVAEFPKEVDYRQGLARCQSNLATFYAESRRLRDAEQAYRKALELQSALAADFPRVPFYRQAVAKACYNLATVLDTPSRRTEAVSMYRQSAGHYEALAAEFPKVPAYREELGGTLNNLAAALADSGQSTEAEQTYRRAIAAFDALVASFPDNRYYQSELGRFINNLTPLLRARKAYPEARQLIQKAIEHQQIAHKLRSDKEAYVQLLARHKLELAEILLELEDHESAAQIASELEKLVPGSPEFSYNAACLLSRCLAVVEKDRRLTDARRRDLARSYGNGAMDQLATALHKGFQDTALLDKDSDLDSLRSRPDFQKLRQQLEKTKKKNESKN